MKRNTSFSISNISSYSEVEKDICHCRVAVAQMAKDTRPEEAFEIASVI